MRRYILLLLLAMFLVPIGKVYSLPGAGSLMPSGTTNTNTQNLNLHKEVFDNIVLDVNGVEKNFNILMRMKFGKSVKLDPDNIFINSTGLYECHVVKKGKLSKIFIDLLSRKMFFLINSKDLEIYKIISTGSFRCFVLDDGGLKDFFMKNRNMIPKDYINNGYSQFVKKWKNDVKDVEYFVVQGSPEEGYCDITAATRENDKTKYVYLFGSGAVNKNISKNNMLLYDKNYSEFCNLLVDLFSKKNLVLEIEGYSAKA